MQYFNRRILGSVAALCLMSAVDCAVADLVSGELFYTRFSGTPNVKSVSYSYDGVTTFTLGTPATVGATPGADGIAGNPQNGDLLIVGGQGTDISTISRSTGTVDTIASPVSVFHLEVPNATTVLTSGIPGALARHGINPDGSLTAGTTIGLSGADSTLTQIITTPTGFFYTSSGPSGTGSYGTITFNTGDVSTATSAVTSRLYGAGGSVSGSALAAAHGGAYDAVTDSILLFGAEHITQLDLVGTILGDLIFAGLTLDQGTVDDSGHAFAASNTGDLAFVDFSASGLITGAGSFSTSVFLDTNLDDIAPLSGSGSTNPSPAPLPSSIALLLVALAGIRVLPRKVV